MSGTSSSIRTKLWWNSHWMVLFQNCVRQSCSPTKMATTVQLCCYWKQLWSRWAITGSWEPLVLIYYQVVYLCCISFCFVAWQDIYFIFAHDLARIFISKKSFQIPLRIKWPSPKRYIGGSRGGQAPLFVLDYRLVKTYFNRIFPVSSLSFFFCFYTPAPRKGKELYCFTSVHLSVLPSVQDIFRRIFLSNCWRQKSDIWSQASYRYPISWEAFLDPSDSYFLFADFVDFYTHWTYMLIFRCIFLSHY